MTPPSGERINITERIAVGFLSGIAAFITAAFIWFVVFFTISTAGFEYQPSFFPVLIFSGVMFLFGFATSNNMVANVLGALWKFLYRGLKFW